MGWAVVCEMVCPNFVRRNSPDGHIPHPIGFTASSGSTTRSEVYSYPKKLPVYDSPDGRLGFTELAQESYSAAGRFENVSQDSDGRRPENVLSSQGLLDRSESTIKKYSWPNAGSFDDLLPLCR
jgi:hypothetical protein